MELISKKDLLAVTGISYGQLYRWKRERLIPDEWFIKRSSYTGQETFFPREQILSRVRTILDAKGKYSLEELARLFSPGTAERELTQAQAVALAGLCPVLRPALGRMWGERAYGFFDAVLLAGVSRVVERLGLKEEPAGQVLGAAMSAAAGTPRSTDCLLTVFRALDVYHAVLSRPGAPLWFDGTCDVVGACDLGELANQMKLNGTALAEAAR